MAKVFQPFSDLSLGWLLRSCLIFGPFQPRLLIDELLIKKKSVMCIGRGDDKKRKKGHLRSKTTRSRTERKVTLDWHCLTTDKHAFKMSFCRRQNVVKKFVVASIWGGKTSWQTCKTRHSICSQYVSPQPIYWFSSFLQVEKVRGIKEPFYDVVLYSRARAHKIGIFTCLQGMLLLCVCVRSRDLCVCCRECLVPFVTFCVYIYSLPQLPWAFAHKL